jgi:hypothetical protein
MTGGDNKMMSRSCMYDQMVVARGRGNLDGERRLGTQNEPYAVRYQTSNTLLYNPEYSATPGSLLPLYISDIECTCTGAKALTACERDATEYEGPVTTVIISQELANGKCDNERSIIAYRILIYG